MDILSAQIALFPSELLRRPDAIYPTINNQMGGLFDAIPTIIPVPENAPPEIPIVQMSSIDGKYKANIARNRIDFFCLALNTIDTFEGVTMRRTTINLRQFAESILKTTQVNRAGCVFAAFKEEEFAVQAIAKKYFIGEDIKRSSELSFSRNSPFVNRGVTLNRLLKISSGRLKKGPLDVDGIIIEQDINTVQTEKALVDKSTIFYMIDQMTSNMGDKELEKLL